MKKKLLIRPGSELGLVNGRPGYPVPGDVDVSEAGPVDVMLLFAETRAELDSSLGETRRLRPGGVLWIAYPKGGARAGTDLNRDILWRHLGEQRLTGVSLVSLDERWSAMRFRSG